MSIIRRNHTLRHTIVAIACGLAAQAASAQSFAPWTQAQPQAIGSMTTADTAPATTPAMHAGIAGAAVIGFAPWQGHTALREMGGTAAPMGDASASVFRPWS